MIFRRARALVALVAGLFPLAAAAAPVVLVADRLTLEDGVATGEGHVSVDLGDQRARGEHFRYDLASGKLTLGPGRWERPEGAIDFSSATLDLGDGTGVVVDGHFQGKDGRLHVEGAALAWTDDHTLEGKDVAFTTCGCQTPPWKVTARAVTVRLDDVATFRGGWIAVCDHRILPVPWGKIPLAPRRSGLLAPALGWGEDGLRVGLPVYATLGPAADLTLTPEVRTARSLRLLGELRYALGPNEGGLLAVAGGSDAKTGTQRGALDWTHRWVAGPVRTGADIQRWSDPAYEADYGDSFFSRTAPWSEALAFLALGPARVETDTFQADTPVGQRPISGLIQAAGVALGPVSGDGTARVDLVLPEGDASEGALARVRADLGASLGHTFGPVRLEARADAVATRWADADPWAEGSLRGAALLPLWAGGEKSRWLMDLGLAGEGSRGLGAATVRLPDDAPPPAWAFGPVLAVRDLRASGVPVSARAALELRPDGILPAGEARLAVNAWSGRIQADPDLQEISSTWDDGRLLVSLAGDRDAALLQSRAEIAWTLPAPLAAWRPGWKGVADLEAPSLLSQGPTLRLKPTCDCLSALLGLTWSADRSVPDVAFHLDVW